MYIGNKLWLNGDFVLSFIQIWVHLWVIWNVNRIQHLEYFNVIKLYPGLKLRITSWNYGSTSKPQETKYPTVNTEMLRQLK